MSAVHNGALALGPHRQEMEKALSDYCGSGYHVLLTCNGTAACYLAIAALNLPPKSRIIVPATTYVATANAIVLNGHVPVIVDVDSKTWCLNDEFVEGQACFVVDLYGVCATVKQTWKPVAIDTCESLGSSCNGTPSVARGAVAVTSFYGSKTLTCGEGGALITRDEKLYRLARSLAEQGHVADYVHDKLAWNFRMSNLNAALLYAQWQRREQIWDAKGDVRLWYLRHLDSAVWNTRQRFMPSVSIARTVWWANVFRFTNRDKVRKALARDGIDTRLVFPPLYEHKHLKQFKTHDCPVAEHLRATGLMLPSGSTLTEAQVARVCKIVNCVGKPVEV